MVQVSSNALQTAHIQEKIPGFGYVQLSNNGDSAHPVSCGIFSMNPNVPVAGPLPYSVFAILLEGISTCAPMGRLLADG
jgi:hypothetical protein